MQQAFVKTYRVARRIVVFVMGVTVLLFGIALIVLPGPAFIVIPCGLAILGIEFAWARRWLKIVKNKANQAITNLKQEKQPKNGRDSSIEDQEIK